MRSSRKRKRAAASASGQEPVVPAAQARDGRVRSAGRSPAARVREHEQRVAQLRRRALRAGARGAAHAAQPRLRDPEAELRRARRATRIGGDLGRSAGGHRRRRFPHHRSAAGGAQSGGAEPQDADSRRPARLALRRTRSQLLLQRGASDVPRPARPQEIARSARCLGRCR